MTLTGIEIDLIGTDHGGSAGEQAVARRVMTGRFALALLLLCGGGPAGAAVIASDAMPSSAISDRLARGPAFIAADIITVAPGALSRPAFDPSAGALGTDGTQPALAPSQGLGSSVTLMPTMRQALPSSVATTDLFADEPVGPGLTTPPRVATAFSTDSTVALPGLGVAGWGSGPHGLEGAADVVQAGRLATPTRSSVFVDPGPRPASGSSAQATAPRLATAQGASALTVYQALRDQEKDPSAASRSVEAYAVSVPASTAAGAAPATLLRLPLKVTNSYGFLGSSLTVFSDDFGSFSGIGQSFNGLMALNVPEPAALAVAMASLVGLAGLLRRRLRG
jgi:hypothetical protein